MNVLKMRMTTRGSRPLPHVKQKASPSGAGEGGGEGAGRRARRRRAWLAGILLPVVALIALDRAYPLPEKALVATGRAGVSVQARQGALVVLAEDGTPLRTWASHDDRLRLPVKVEDVSPRYIEALLHYEDRWFDWHPGINPVAMTRAAWQWATNGRVVSGGSTLTMQVARIVDDRLQTKDRSVGVKLRQMARALQLEARSSKRQILSLYLDHAPMGGQIEGVEMASRTYLGKPSRELSHAEAALLVALPQTPSRLRPDRAPGQAQRARDKVLDRMHTLGTWTAASVADAKLERVFAPAVRARWLAPLAAQRLRSEAMLAARKRGTAVPNALHSTLDAGVQVRLEQMLLDRLGSLPEHVSIAAMVLENDTLAVRGYAGSADFGDDTRASHVDMVRAVRSPGSTLKPFLYAMALDDGLVHSESLLIDAPQNFGGYAPGNFESSFAGPVSVSEALQRSLNVPAVDLLDRIGPARFAAQLRNAGLRLRMPEGAAPNLSLILGGGGTTLEELVGAYSALARDGVAGTPRLTPQAPLSQMRLMSPGAAFIVREILENGGRPDAPFRESHTRVAWKTGTSFGFRDAWAVGVTDRYTVGVWVGRPDGTPNPGHFGANTSAPLVKDVLAALGDTTTKPRTVPASVRAADICWPLGLAHDATPPAFCRVRRAAWTLDGAAPPTLPDRVRGGGLVETAWVDSTHGTRVRPGCIAVAVDGKAHTQEYARWPALLEPWIGASWRSDVEQLPWAQTCHDTNKRAHAPSRSLRVTGIDAGSVIRAAPGAKDAVVRVQAIGSRDPITWLLDGRVVGSTATRGEGLRLRLEQAGDHALTAIDTQGRYDRVVFSVR
jgi:penicillin-binding protein 1C